MLFTWQVNLAKNLLSLSIASFWCKSPFLCKLHTHIFSNVGLINAECWLSIGTQSMSVAFETNTTQQLSKAKWISCLFRKSTTRIFPKIAFKKSLLFRASLGSLKTPIWISNCFLLTQCAFARNKIYTFLLIEDYSVRVSSEAKESVNAFLFKESQLSLTNTRRPT